VEIPVAAHTGEALAQPPKTTTKKHTTSTPMPKARRVVGDAAGSGHPRNFDPNAAAGDDE
jgi:hypothetical protein